METIRFSCSRGIIYDNMLPTNASEKLTANSYKEDMGGRGREGEIQDSTTLDFCETRLVYVKKCVILRWW